MSADNWAKCPRCVRARNESLARRQSELDAAYGNVPLAGFDRMRSALDDDRARELQSTFREDYEFYGIEDGVLCVSYSGSCKVCGLSKKFECREPIDIAPNSPESTR